jgi:hypothetical protein
MTLQELLGDAYKEGMTIEEIETALKDKDLYEGYVKKEVFDKTASEVAKLKKQLRDKMTEEEQRTELERQKLEELEVLRKKVQVNELEKKYLQKGFSAERALKVANALIEGDYDTVATESAKHAEELVNAAKAEALKPPLSGGGSADDQAESWGAKLADENLKILGLKKGGN